MSNSHIKLYKLWSYGRLKSRNKSAAYLRHAGLKKVAVAANQKRGVPSKNPSIIPSKPPTSSISRFSGKPTSSNQARSIVNSCQAQPMIGSWTVQRVQAVPCCACFLFSFTFLFHGGTANWLSQLKQLQAAVVELGFFHDRGKDRIDTHYVSMIFDDYWRK